MKKYLITVTSDDRWSEPDTIWCVSELNELEKNLEHCAEEQIDTDEFGVIQVWELTNVTVVPRGFAIHNLPKKAAK